MSENSEKQFQKYDEIIKAVASVLFAIGICLFWFGEINPPIQYEDSLHKICIYCLSFIILFGSFFFTFKQNSPNVRYVFFFIGLISFLFLFMRYIKDFDNNTLSSNWRYLIIGLFSAFFTSLVALRPEKDKSLLVSKRDDMQLMPMDSSQALDVSLNVEDLVVDILQKQYSRPLLINLLSNYFQKKGIVSSTELITTWNSLVTEIERIKSNVEQSTVTRRLEVQIKINEMELRSTEMLTAIAKHNFERQLLAQGHTLATWEMMMKQKIETDEQVRRVALLKEQKQVK